MCGGNVGAADKRGPSSGEKSAERSEADEVEKQILSVLGGVHKWEALQKNCFVRLSSRGSKHLKKPRAMQQP